MNFSRNSSYFKNLFQQSYQQYGYSPQALQWTSKQTMDNRFEALTRCLDFESKSVLDVGCGFGDIIPFIEKKAKSFNYLGIDLVEQMASEARKQYPDYKFTVGDYFADPIKEKFDIVLTSGTLNGNLGFETLSFRLKAIEVMWEHANEVCAFNMLGSHPQPGNDPGYLVHYADSLEILSFCLTLTPKLVFIQDYDPEDFTVIMHR
jgi:SAM-dependent methyltransferase